jgi:hypothetical protein
MLVGVELTARFYLGLGDPPLMIADPEIEYMFAPNQSVRRFGNSIRYNGYSMRATPDFARDLVSDGEFRVLLLGDSVVNGGALLDDAAIASTLLQQQLANATRHPVLVMNASAGSWGPPNLLAYVRRYGMFEAHVVVIVLNGGDDQDVFEPVSIVGTTSFPDRRPLFATQELIERYAVPRLRGLFSAGPAATPTASAELVQANRTATHGAIRELVSRARSEGRTVFIALHQDINELRGQPGEGSVQLRELAESLDVPVIDLASAFRDALSEGQTLFFDDIHPTAAGHRLIAQRIYEALLPMLLAR